MFKKALQVVTTFGLLVASYAVYTRTFAAVTQWLVPLKTWTVTHALDASKGKKEAIALAERALGRGHWAADKDKPLRYYNSQHGFWLYALSYDRLNDGKTVKLTPFAAIWQDRHGKALKTATSDSATIDFDRPLNFADKPGAGPLRVLHGRLEGNVVIHDDKGTETPDDDLRVTGLTYAKYDDDSLLITGDDNDTAEIVDRDMRITGLGLVIKLRPKDTTATPPGAPPPTVGFEGAQTAILKRNVHVVLSDVGSQGILPGASQPQQRQGDKTPLNLRCDGAMQIDLPKPHMPVRVGPPAPSGPTFAQFVRNVEVLRGKPGITPDQLTCDELRLTLVPADKPPTPPAPFVGPPKPGDEARFDEAEALASARPAAPAQNDGPLTDLTLQRADATGHNVHVVSAAQGIKARCNQLIHKKKWPDAPDETYLRGDASTKLIVYKTDLVTEGPDKGKVSSFTTIRTIDATIFDNHTGNNDSSIVARGPGDLETRPGLDKPIERTAHWADQLLYRNEPTVAAKPGEPPPPAPAEPLKQLILTGNPGFADIPSQTKLDSSKILVVWLKPKAEATAKATTDPNVMPTAGQSFEIHRLVAQPNVHLTAPNRTLVARESLDALFTPVPGPAATPSSTPATAPAASSEKPATTTPAGQPKPAEPAKPVEPEAKAIANRVWASIRLLPETPGQKSSATRGSTTTGGTSTSLTSTSTGDRRAEIDKVFLRGDVAVHQAPAEGKTKGTDVVGEAADVFDRGNGLSKFIVYSRDAYTQATRSASPVKPAAFDPGAEPARFAPPARIDSDEMTVTGNVIGLDQSTDFAWVEGAGSLTQMTTRGLLSDKSTTTPAKPDAPAGPAARTTPVRPAGYVADAENSQKTKAKDKAKGNEDKDKAKAKAQEEKVPLTIIWASGMKFWGRSTNLQGQPAGKAEFYDDVRADMEDSAMSCNDVMRVFFDRTVKLNRPKDKPARDPDAEADADDAEEKPEEPRPDIAVIELVDNVVVVNAKRDPANPRVLTEKQQIQGQYLIYDRATGKFRVPGEGEVFLWQRDGSNSTLSQQLGVPSGSGNRSGSGPGNTNRNNNGGGAPPLPNPNPTSARTIRPTAGPPPGQRQRSDQAAPVVGRNDTARRNSDAQQKTGLLPRPKPEKQPYTITQVHFRRDMLGRFGTGKDTDKVETRWADFFGDVESVHGPVPDVDTVLDPDRIGADTQFLAAQVLRVVSEPNRSNPDAPARNWLRAWENATATTSDKIIQADTISYDSEKTLFYALGENGNDVVVSNQGAMGGDASATHGRAFWYNQKTGASDFIEPGGMIQIIDQKTGTRPAPSGAPLRDLPVQRPKRVPFRNPRVNIERKDFNGH